jgi:hypothetical protein
MYRWKRVNNAGRPVPYRYLTCSLALGSNVSRAQVMSFCSAGTFNVCIIDVWMESWSTPTFHLYIYMCHNFRVTTVHAYIYPVPWYRYDIYLWCFCDVRRHCISLPVYRELVGSVIGFAGISCPASGKVFNEQNGQAPENAVESAGRGTGINL